MASSASTPAARGASTLALASSIALLVALGCGDGPRLAGEAPRSGGATPAQGAGRPTSAAAVAASTVSTEHDRYAAAGIACESCHPCGAASGHGASWTDPASSGFHAVAADAGIGACATCHGVDLGGGAAGVSCAQCHGADWKTNCVMCHGGAEGTTGAPPRATWGHEGDPVRVGSHTAHVAGGAVAGPFDCGVCHVKPADALAAGHVDGPTATVTFGGIAAQGATPAWDRATATCASVYCHGRVQAAAGGPLTGALGDYRDPTWGGAAPGCGGCHGHPPDSGSHAKHAGTAAGQYGFECEECHDRHVPPAPDVTGHVNGRIDTVIRGTWGGRYEGGSTPGTGFAACADTYCHGSGTGGTKNTGGVTSSAFLNAIDDPRPAPPSASPRWGDAPYGCDWCHGYPPSYPSGDPKANTHTSTHGGASMRCYWCHAATTLDGRTIADPSRHGNGIYDVVPDRRPYPRADDDWYRYDIDFSYAYDAGGGRCSNNACHGGFSETWGGVRVGAGGYFSLGPGCYEVIAHVSVVYGSAVLPLSYDWNFGDGTTASGTTSAVPTDTPHTYAKPGSYVATLSIRDAQYHVGEMQTWVSPQPADVPPSAAFTVSVSKCEATLTDLSSDPDYDTCGHSGPGKTTILWGDVTRTDGPLDLTDVPSNRTFTHGYASKGSYTVSHFVTDNASYTVQSQPNATVNVAPPTIQIAGQIADAAGSGVPNVAVDLLGPGGNVYSWKNTDSQGRFTFYYAADYCAYSVRPRPSSLFTFVPASAPVDPWRGNASVSFTARAIPQITVAGKVTAGGVGLSNMRVCWNQVDPASCPFSVSGCVATKADGSYSFGGPECCYAVAASDPAAVRSFLPAGVTVCASSAAIDFTSH